MHHVARDRLMQAIAPSLTEFQIGGVPKMSVQFASHFLQVLRENAKHTKRSHAVLFVDIRNAFYTAQRQTLVPDRLGCPNELQDEDIALSVLSEPTALEAFNASPTLQAWVQTIITGNWSQVKTADYRERAHLALVPSKGTRPGDPISDLAFTAGLTQILQQVQQDLHGILTVHSLQPHPIEAPPIVWVDDIALFLEDADPMKLIEKVQRAVAVLYSRCKQRGLLLNFANGKTELLFRFEGRGSQSAQKHVQSLPNQRLPIPSIEETVALSAIYTHLGLRQSVAMHDDTTVLARLAQAQLAYKDAYPLLVHPSLTVTAKCTLASSLLYSQLLFGAEVWTQLEEATWSRLRAYVNKVQRTILRRCNRRDTQHYTSSRYWDYLGLHRLSC